MTDAPLKARYQAYPYPDRDPADEPSRLITGSPSWPPEMDHWLWGGARDWRTPLRVLVAGGGTGDGLVQIAQTLTTAGRPYHITYVDLSDAARRVAQARVAARDLSGVSFVTGSFLDQSGPFDYIDCCGVLHHLADPAAGLRALAGMLAPGGGIGLMVYAPHGRSGVYPLQSSFRRLFGALAPQDAVRRAKDVLPRLPEAHPFKRNLHLGDHETSDAGFYDLLLHSQDQALTISELSSLIARAGLEIAGTPEPTIYDPSDLLPAELRGTVTQPLARMQLSEDLRGTIKTHVVYLVRAGARVPPPTARAEAVPVFCAVNAAGLASLAAAGRPVSLSVPGKDVEVLLSKATASVIADVDGYRSLAEIAARQRVAPQALVELWAPVEDALAPFGHLHYSGVFAP